MNPIRTSLCWLAAGLVAALPFRPHSASAEVPESSLQPRIVTIGLDAEIAVVTVFVPAGVRRVVLEGSQRGDLRGWIPLAVERPDGSAHTVTFRVPARYPNEVLRVRAEATSPLPAAFYGGRTDIRPSVLPQGFAPSSPNRAEALVSGGTPVYQFGVDASNAAVPTLQPAPTALSIDGGARPIEEADIWKRRGSRIYFFNQMRGLQVIDISNADRPVLVSTMSLPAAGEQLYVLDDQHLALLVRGACSDGTYDDGALLILDVSGTQPRELARLPIPGQVGESRLVGGALYVASQAYEPDAGGANEWRMNTVISSFDLSNPNASQVRPGRRIPGSATAVTASGDFFFVALTDNGGNAPGLTHLHALDVSAADGTIVDFAIIPLQGVLRDKFKLNLYGDVLRVVVEDQSGGARPGLVTRLTTFRLGIDGADNYSELGSLELGAGESLFATRFDGDRAYVVTYRRVDPLWIIDLSDPSRPRVAGELQVPGWSNYIHPLGDRLLTVGIDDTSGWRAAVQLFDVSNPSQPALLSKVPLGENWSSTEANSDEKALGVFPEEGLVLIPLEAGDSNGAQNGVQLLDLQRDRLVRRGLIRHSELTPRRATMVSDRVLSLSARELLSVDISQRDRPVITSTLDLSQRVDRLLVVGAHLLKFSGRGLEVSDASLPETSLSQTALGTLPVLGATARADRLYVLQGTQAEMVGSFDATIGTWIYSTNAGRLQLTVFDVSQLPAVSKLGETIIDHDETSLPALEPLWPTAETLVWSATVSGGMGGGIIPLLYMRGGPSISFATDVAGGGMALEGPAVWPSQPVTADLSLGGGSLTVFPSINTGIAFPTLTVRSAVWNWFWPGNWYGNRQVLAAFDVRNGGDPAFRSLRHSQDGTLRASAAFTAGGLVLFSEERQDSEVIGTNFVVSVESETVMTTNLVWRTNVTVLTHEHFETNRIDVDIAYPAVQRAWGSSGSSAPLLAIGASHTLLNDRSGVLWTWGDTVARIEPDGSPRDPAQSERVDLSASLTALTAGTRLSFALDVDGQVWSWRSQPEIVLPPLPGEPPVVQPPPEAPAIVAGLPGARAIASGHLHVLAAAGGETWAWGNNAHGQLGRAAPASAELPVRVEGIDAPSVAVAAGAEFSLALTEDGRVLAWGANDQSQLGLLAGSSGDLPKPVLVMEGARAIAAGAFHGVALAADGSVWTWGRNREGQLGREAFGNEPKPLPVPGLPPVRAIAAGAFHTLALTEDGRAWMWGAFDPDGAPAQWAPIELSAGSRVEAIAGGRRHAVLFTSDGRSIAWGRGDAGRLGDGEPLELHGVGEKFDITTTVEHTYVTNVVSVLEISKERIDRSVTNAIPELRWLQSHRLVAMDYAADPAHPVVRPALTLPGVLQGISHQGEVLYTVADRTEETPQYTTKQVLEASTYDGVSLFLNDSRVIADSGAGESALVTVTPNAQLLITRGSWQANAVNLLQVVALNSNARFIALGELPLSGQPQGQKWVGGVLGVRNSAGLELFDLSDAGAPRVIPSADIGCLPFDINLLTGDLPAGLWVPAGDYGAIRAGPE